MKNAFITGIVIGVLSGLWLFIMHLAGYDLTGDNVSPFEYISCIIPVVVLFVGVKLYRDRDLGGNMGFLEALVQSFKILVLGGIIAGFLGILYISYIDHGASNLSDFSGRLFGALLVGILSALAVSLILHTKSNKVD
jgi:ABC-type Fe3+ transport system permease subunit